MAHRFILIALAHIEVVGPKFDSMINYCAAEGLDQTKYLESLDRCDELGAIRRGLAAIVNSGRLRCRRLPHFKPRGKIDALSAE